MSANRVLVFSPFFYPEAISTGKYNSVLVQALVDRGFSVDVITSHPLYPAWKPMPSSDRLPGVNIHRGGAWVRYTRIPLLRRAIFELWFAAHAAWQARKLRHSHASLAIAVFPPTLFFCLINWLLPVSVRKVGIVHDLQGVLGFSGGNPLSRLLRRLVFALESRAFRGCDQLIVLSNSMAEEISRRCAVPRENVKVCYPFVTLNAGGSPGQELAEVLPAGVPNIVYAGALGNKQNPWGLYGFLRAVAARFPNVKCHVFSDGPAFEELRKFHAAQSADGIRFHHLVKESQLEELYTRSTVQVIPQVLGSHNACLPSKLPNILSSGCSVLAICPPGSELAHIVRRAGAGFAAESWDSEVLLSTLHRVLEHAQQEDREQRCSRARQLLVNQFNIDDLVHSLLGFERGVSPQRFGTVQSQAYAAVSVAGSEQRGS